MFNFFSAAKTEPSLPEKFLDSLEEGVLAYDSNFRILQLNVAAKKTLGLAEAPIGEKISPADLNDPKKKNLVQLIFPSLAAGARALSEPGVWPQKSELTLGNGRTVVAALLKDEQGKFFKIFRDLSGAKSMEKTREDFISVAAHQIRTPLTSLHWALEQIQATNREESLKPIITEALAVSERTLKIANDLLDAAQLEEGRLELNKTKLHLRTWMEAIVREFKPFADAKKVSVVLTVPDELAVDADEGKISVVLGNLIDNALKYNLPGGRVEINCAAAGGFAKISVRDTGIGVPPKELERLFEKLYRGVEATRLEPNGSGLGLYITRNIVERHGGRLSVESEVGRGSVFTFTLPIFQAPDNESFRI